MLKITQNCLTIAFNIMPVCLTSKENKSQSQIKLSYLMDQALCFVLPSFCCFKEEILLLSMEK